MANLLPAEDLLRAFEQYYSGSDYTLEYTETQQAVLMKHYGWMSETFKLVVYDEVLSQHGSQFRSLPDIAAIEKAIHGLDRPETYEVPVPLLEAPMDVDNNPKDRDVWLDFLARIGSELGKRADNSGEMNHEERERVRYRIAHNDATLYERHWVWCVENNGVYVPPEKGPYASEFRSAQERDGLKKQAVVSRGGGSDGTEV